MTLSEEQLIEVAKLAFYAEKASFAKIEQVNYSSFEKFEGKLELHTSVLIHYKRKSIQLSIMKNGDLHAHTYRHFNKPVEELLRIYNQQMVRDIMFTSL